MSTEMWICLTSWGRTSSVSRDPGRRGVVTWPFHCPWDLLCQLTPPFPVSSCFLSPCYFSAKPINSRLLGTQVIVPVWLFLSLLPCAFEPSFPEPPFPPPQLVSQSPEPRVPCSFLSSVLTAGHQWPLGGQDPSPSICYLTYLCEI